MTSLLRDPEVAPDAPASESPTQDASAAPACRTCSTPLEPGQDWCLQCGQAQPGRLASLPGRRVGATIAVLTTLMVGGAVAAAYAALDDESPAAAQSTQLALVPAPSAVAPPAPVTPVDPSAATPAAPLDPGTTTDDGALPDAGATPEDPVPQDDTAPLPSDDAVDTPAETDTGTDDTTDETATDDDTAADTRTSTTPAVDEPEPIELADDAVTIYDPYTRNTATGADLRRLLDGNLDTSVPIVVAAGSTSINAGLTAELPSKQGIREIELQTKTPGFRVEIYATDSKDLPADILDARWAHIKDVPDVGAEDDGKQTIVLGAGSTKYRRLLLWFTAAPTDGTTVRVSELKLLG